ncbi:STAS domain-containing protein [Actinorugispora endophytica]|uniref:Anti-sigma factor antagonist n=1 Tax=Actinorugispora endophytica TaxID=1605990 RepID=A0A4R6V0U5_9ACTN|nr:STAS domain-containing protein [Actinorugispora endophytica]TDQ53422.1 anti-sigma B factor antagonist/stage II sporulation protein AA (anti-sigma F factor antagonist) [Actinorugispora endophytica]
MSGQSRESFPCREAVVFAVRGEIDIANAARLCAGLLQATDRPECGCLVVDLSRVGFIDLSGVRALMECYRILTREGRHMVLAEPSSPAARILDALDMGQTFEIYPIVETALVHTGRQRYEEGPFTGVSGAD